MGQNTSNLQDTIQDWLGTVRGNHPNSCETYCDIHVQVWITYTWDPWFNIIFERGFLCPLQKMDFLLWFKGSHTLPKMKSRFLTCPCHKIDRVEAVGLFLSIYTFKIKIFVSMWNLEQFCQ